MRLMLEEDLAGCASLEEMLVQTKATLAACINDGYEVHYVAGPISCDGDDKIPENLEALITERTKLMRSLGKGAVVFTSPFVFTAEKYRELGLFKLSREDRESRLRGFWRDVIASGLISGVHFAPGWRRSPGSLDEHEAALANKVRTYYALEDS